MFRSIGFLLASGAILASAMALAPAPAVAQGLGGPASVQGPRDPLPPPPGGVGVGSGRNADTEPLPGAEQRAAPSVAGNPGRQPAPSGAAEPGRRESPPPAAPASPAAREPLSERQKMVERTLQCRMDKVARMLELAVAGPESSASMGLEREVLVLCRDRGNVVRDMIDAELKLAAILRTDRLAREQAAIEMEARRQAARARIEGARQGAAEAARAVEERRLVEERAKAEAEEAARATEPGKKEEPAPAPVVVVEAPRPKTHEKFSWYTIIGSGDDLRAGVTDGSGRWMVGVGDELPDGARVTQISARPPKVRTAGGPPSGLPYRGAR